MSDAGWANDVDTFVYSRLTSVSGTNTVVGTGPVSMTAYATGQRFTFIPAATNTGATTLNITPSGGSALGAKNIFWNGAACVGGEIRISVPTEVMYDGTQFNILSNSESEQTFTPALSIGGTPPTSYTTQVGNYTKLGGRLFFSVTIRLNVAGAGTGNVTITGLPVAARAGAATERNVCGFILTGQSTGLTTESLIASVAPGATVIDLWTYTAGSISAFSVGTLTNSVQFNVTGSYPI